jgi:hypothetical protein
MEAKCRTLLLCRLHIMYHQGNTMTTLWLRRWGLFSRRENPPFLDSRLFRYRYLQLPALDYAYVAPRNRDEMERTYRRRVYRTITLLLQDTPNGREMRIATKWPHADWGSVWTNLWTTPVDRHVIAVWYNVIHDLVPTRLRLHAIHLVPTDLCPSCNITDTLAHHLTECGQGIQQWEWARVRLALMLRVDKHWIPTEWLLRPHFRLWPPPRHRAVLWTLATYIDFRRQRGPSLRSAICTTSSAGPNGNCIKLGTECALLETTLTCWNGSPPP